MAGEIRKMMRIETLIKSIKESGCSIFVVDNEKIVLELPKTIKKNEIALKKEEQRNQRDHELNGSYASHFSPDCEYDYEIPL